jgi:hypothetical protein
VIIAGYKFVHVCDVEPVRREDGSVKLHMPQERYRNVRSLPLNNYGKGPFCKFTIDNGLQASGVYVLTVERQVRYVGECANLSARFNVGYGNISPKNCFKGGQETNCRLNNLIYTAVEARQVVALWFLPTADYKSIEAFLRSSLKPTWNRA